MLFFIFLIFLKLSIGALLFTFLLSYCIMLLKVMFLQYREDDNNIYSSSGRRNTPQRYEDISSVSKPRRSKGKRRKKRRVLKNLLIAVICLLTAACAGFYLYAYRLINTVKRTPLDKNDIGINSEEPQVYENVRNIALLGLDTRQDNNVGRSDAIVILTVDKAHNKLKLTSIARDTYVAIEGHSKDKLTHAYAYGKSQLAVKTLNQNFNLEISDYVTMNFFGLARVIDYINGVTVNVTEAEKNELNRNIFPEMRSLKMECPDIASAGEQTLNGAQAVCYARIRHIDSDVQRGNRQKTVLMAMFNKAKSLGALKLPQFAQMFLKECETSLSANDIISLGSWGLISSPEFEQLSVPNESIPSSGKIIKGVWYYVYDLETAKNNIKDFILEENSYSAQKADGGTAE